ncbi:MAG TPA: DMT family transporter, partial [Anaerolineales bacterium]|nr:DMT family transporter [Anaerolineales bacterium]
AALATSFCFAVGIIFFTISGKMVGAQVTNRIRLVFALIYLLIVNVVLYRQPIPLSASSDRWIWLGLSGIIGLTLGDVFLFQSFIMLGARLGSLVFSLSPIFSAILAWVFFREELSLLQISGIVISLAGVAWVIMSNKNESDSQQGDMRRGIIFGLLGALSQSVGILLAKPGLTENFPAFSAGVIRMLAATVAIWILALFQRQAGDTVKTIREQPRALWFLAFGALFGPVLGVSASLLALQNAQVGVVSTLSSLFPIMVLPLSYYIFKERFGWQAWAGTALAIVGVAILFLS